MHNRKGKIMNKKKMITLLLTLCALLPLASCGRTVGEGAGRITTVGADSAPAGSETTAASSDTEGDPNRVTFVAAGDNIIHDSIIVDAKNLAATAASTGAYSGTYYFDRMYDGIRDIVSSADLAYVNQEGPVAGDSLGVQGYPTFNAPEEVGDALIGVGFDIVNIANNHMLDMDNSTRTGYKSTLEYWKTKDIWVANGRFGWDYNHLYDLFYQAGVPLEMQRVASPFISQAIASLKLYRAIDPDMWGKMVSRVNGVNFAGLYGDTSMMGWHSIKLPPNMTWEGYLDFLLKTLPENTRKNYQRKLSVSMNFWRDKGGCLADETIRKLEKMGIPITVGDHSNYRTEKKPVRMEYLDDIDIPEFKELPTFKRMCICILKNDHTCKYMGFSLNKAEKEQKERVMEKYKALI